MRYVYERLRIDDEDYAVALTIYVHQEGVREANIQQRIRERFASYDATADGLRTLETSSVEAD